MTIYILIVFLAYVITRFLADRAYELSRKKNLLIHPGKNDTFANPVLDRFIPVIVIPVLLLLGGASIYFNQKFREYFEQDMREYAALFIFMIIASLMANFSMKYIIRLLLFASAGTFAVYFSQSTIQYPEYIHAIYYLPLTLLWFSFFFVIFYRKKEHLSADFLSGTVMMITLFFISFYLEFNLYALIFLITGICFLCLYRFSVYPSRIVPGIDYRMLFISMISYVALVRNLKLTMLSILLFIPLADIYLIYRKEKSLSFSLLQAGLPEDKVNFYILAVQSVAGVIAFIMVHMKSEMISFFVFITIFLTFYILNYFYGKK
ncbi:MAG: hypothetical protein ACOCWO_02025 [Candidatus Muiribacteriaceae bacterium]